LGLSTVFGIVEQHQGWIDVQSSVGRGSSFTLFIPAQAAPVALTEQTVTSVAPLSGHGRILVADDNEQLRVITARILRNAGYEVIEARDGITAREALKDANGSIDLLLSDVVMPGGIMGDELARDAQIRPGTKIILMSASVENLDLAAFEASGGSYLSKPFDTQQLLAAVRSKLDPMAVSG